MKETGAPTYASDFEMVHAHEREHIRARRVAAGQDCDAPVSGLALSGGGIRAAAFGLGVARALHDRGLFDALDYMSTVSGGGFTGGFLTWQRHATGFRPSASQNEPTHEIVASEAIAYVRDHADYLAPAAASGSAPVTAAAARGSREARLTTPTAITDAAKSGKDVVAPSLTALLANVLGQSLLTLFVYTSLLVGLFFFLHIGDATVRLLRPIAKLLWGANAWVLLVDHLNLAGLLSLGGLLLGGLRVLLGVPLQAVANAARTVTPLTRPPSAIHVFGGAGFYLLGLVSAALAVAALLSNQFVAGPIAALLLGLLSAYSLRRFYRAWSAPGRASSGPTRFIALIVAGLAAVVPCAGLIVAVGWYALESGPAKTGAPPQLDARLGALLFVVALAAFLLVATRGLRWLFRLAAHVGRELDPGAAYRQDLRSQRQHAANLTWVSAWMLLASVPWVSGQARTLLNSRFGLLVGLGVAVLASVFVLGARVVTSARSSSGGAAQDMITSSGSAARWAAYMAAGAFLFGLLLLAHDLTEALLMSAWPAGPLVIVIAGLLVGTLSDLNSSGPGRLFRDRVSEAFLPEARAIREQRWQPAYTASDFPLAKLATMNDGAAYPLINTSLTTTGSARASYRQRGADSFVLSPLYCGSLATGWMPTQHWLGGRLTLRDAIGASAAAVAPGASSGGLHGAGSWLIGSALSLLNLRLGFWVNNPNPIHGRSSRTLPNLLRPGLSCGVLHRGVSETARHVRLSDGGFFDELGLYELLRRRVHSIVVSDATEDPEYHFTQLGRALSRAEQDFGVEIVFPSGVLYPSAEGASHVSRAVRRDGFAFGEILYPGSEAVGTLLIIKPILVEEVSLASFAAGHQGFPHETTFDQRFTPEHFRAYESLGRRLTRRALDAVADEARPEGISDRPPMRYSMFRVKEPRPSVAVGGGERNAS